MCQLACRSSVFVMVDPWEAKQSAYQRTLTVLCRVKNYLCENTLVPAGSLEVMLVSGSDLLESFRKSFWIPEQVQAIVRDFGVACIRMEGKDVEKMLSYYSILREMDAYEAYYLDKEKKGSLHILVYHLVSKMLLLLLPFVLLFYYLLFSFTFTSFFYFAVLPRKSS
ncbi:nicotinamide/nicotinic acid mononucleotide adenylyltransferase-like [Silene latifolia]|uniref:nicotinamide/nicotinic acid mononucleotide adenylyltransferase-like n=1 Tax=Silene latifolia TaxID=37657 RepID=UPI003D773E3E